MSFASSEEPGVAAPPLFSPEIKQPSASPSSSPDVSAAPSPSPSPAPSLVSSTPVPSSSPTAPLFSQKQIEELTRRLPAGHTLCYLCHDKTEGAEQADAMQKVLSTLIDKSLIYLNSEENVTSVGDLKKTNCMLLLLTPRFFFRAYTFVEVALAIKFDIPIVPILFVQNGYDEKQNELFLSSEEVINKLEEETPGANAWITSQGFSSISETSKLIASTLANMEPVRIPDFKQIESKEIDEILGRILKSMQTTAIKNSEPHLQLSSVQDSPLKITKDNASKLKRLRILYEHRDYVTSVCFNPKVDILASCSHDQTVKIWDMKREAKLIKSFHAHSGHVKSMTFSPNGIFLATVSRDKTIRVWNLSQDGELVHTFQDESVNLYSVSFSYDGGLLATSVNQKIKIWDLKHNGKLINILEGHLSAVYSVKFSPNSFMLASGSDDYTIKLWDLNDHGKLVKTISEHACVISSVCYNSDASILASGGFDHLIMLWDMKNNGKRLMRLAGHSSCIFSVCFSPDDSLLASVCNDQHVNLWDVKNGGKLLRSLPGHTAFIYSVSFSRDGVSIASGSADSSIAIWGLEPENE